MIIKMIALAKGFKIEKRKQHYEWNIFFNDNIIFSIINNEDELDENYLKEKFIESGFYSLLLHRAKFSWNIAQKEDGIFIIEKINKIIITNILEKEIIDEFVPYYQNKELTSMELALESALEKILDKI